jgi:putative hydrolase of the HAD superfamily
MTGTAAPDQIELILFDVGGVLVELTGASALEWTEGRMDEEELRRRWLASTAVRKYETGQSDSDEFARGVVGEFELPVTPDDFLREFSMRPKGPYSGAADLLRALSGTFRLATLSNTNEIHWSRFQEFGILDFLQDHFASHKIGLLKPHMAAFQHVVEATGVPPEYILFLDDYQLNVDGAKAVGMNAYRVSGASGARARLEDLRLLERTEGQPNV